VQPPIDQRSQPWWQKVTTYGGEGSTTTAAFDIAPRAVQWRANWHCQSGSLVVQPQRQGESEQPRPLVQMPNCSGQDGKAYATATGRFALRVTASAPWQLDIEQQVDSPFVEDPLTQMTAPGASVVVGGPMYDVDHNGKGTAKIYRLPDGTSALRLEDFFVTPTSDLQLRLSGAAAPKTTAEVAGAPFKNVGFLKATVGSMNFPLPDDVDLTQFHSLVIWCELTQNAYAAAALGA